jgi:hypothetical protein
MWIISIGVGSNYKYPSVRFKATTLIITEATKVPVQHRAWSTAPQTSWRQIGNPSERVK